MEVSRTGVDEKEGLGGRIEVQVVLVGRSVSSAFGVWVGTGKG